MPWLSPQPARPATPGGIKRPALNINLCSPSAYLGRRFLSSKLLRHAWFKSRISLANATHGFAPGPRPFTSCIYEGCLAETTPDIFSSNVAPCWTWNSNESRERHRTIVTLRQVQIWKLPSHTPCNEVSAWPANDTPDRLYNLSCSSVYFHTAPRWRLQVHPRLRS